MPLVAMTLPVMPGVFTRGSVMSNPVVCPCASRARREEAAATEVPVVSW